MTILTLICTYCQQSFKRTLKQHNIYLSRGRKNSFCSSKCYQNFTRQRELFELCVNCNQILKGKYNYKFCSNSCSATYNNKHKTTGTRVSKLEVYLQTKLAQDFPDLEFHFNRKDAIGSELDIYISELKLAFELNGIFHYEPIFGDQKLEQIQRNDINKFQVCQAKEIGLCIIDTSSFRYFKTDGADKYLRIIKEIIIQNSCTLERN